MFSTRLFYQQAFVIFLAAFLLMTTAPAYADTIRVNSADDTLQNGDAKCTLREAITNANDNANTYTECFRIPTAGVDIITFSFSYKILINITGTGEDLNTKGDFDITDSVTFENTNISPVIIDGNGLDRVFDIIGSSTTVSISNITIQNGAVIGTGGGINSSGTLTVTDSTIKNNSSSSFGGGILSNDGATLIVTRSTISGNTSGSNGGGIYNIGALTINNSTISGNTAAANGGGISLFSAVAASATINNSTITGNNASTGGGIINSGMTTSLTNNIVADQLSGADCSGTITSSGYNLESGISCGFTAAGDLQNTNPMLGPLASNGGLTMSHALLAGSSAIDAGTCTVAMDQRGVAKPQDVTCDIGAYEYSAPMTFTVTKTEDTADGACDADCSIREAIGAANMRSGATVSIPAGNYTTTLAGASEDANATGDFDILSNVTIMGAGANSTIIDGGGLDRIFHINGLFNVSITGVIVQNGNTDTSFGGGGGILNDGGALTITSCAVSNNISNIGGGGILSESGSLNIINSTINGNESTNSAGGGVNNQGGVFTVNNSTFSDNTSDANGGGIYNGFGSVVTITNSTITRNWGKTGTSASGVRNWGSTITFSNTIVANQISGADCHVAHGGVNISDDHNLESGTSCGFTEANDIQGTDALIAQLSNNGGPTPTIGLKVGSPAIDSGSCVNPTDQRGVARPQGAACDIGAFEGLVTTSTFTVTKTEDTADGVCDADCSLREAVIAVNNGSGAGDTINIPTAGLYALTRAGAGEDMASTGDLDLLKIVTIVGASSNSVIIDGGSLDRVFHNIAADNTTISGVTIQNGSVTGDGGGIWTEHPLTINRSVIYNNAATALGGGIYGNGTTVSINESTIGNNSATGDGGGYYSLDSTVSINRSTINNNSSSSSASILNGGGGFYSRSSSGTTNVTFTNTTISGNTAAGYGGGLYILGQAEIKNSTITANSAPTGGGIYRFNGATNLANSIVANQTSGGDCSSLSGSITSSGSNLESATSCGFTGTGDLQNSNPLLGPLADNGVPTMTHALLPGSPAINAGNNATCESTDQRGVIRPQGVNCDIGAYESGAAIHTVSTSVANGSITPANAVAADGMTTTFGIFPNIGHHIVSVTGCGGSLVGGTYTTGPITADCTVTATIAINTYIVTATAGSNGSITPLSQTIDHGSTAIFTITPDFGYSADVTGCGGSLVDVTYTTGPITAACTVTATFILNSHTVTKTADTADGFCDVADCSLREAVMAANNSLGFDNINLPDGVYTIGIGGAGEDLGATGDIDITGDFALTPIGNGPVIIDGGGNDRVFHIIGAHTVSLTGITIRNGSVTGPGGGIFNDGGALTIENSVIHGGMSTTSGGGIHNTGTVNIVNSTVSGSSATVSGGGIGNSGAINATNVTITDNRSADGAGIWNSGGAVKLDNSIVAGQASGVDCSGAIMSDGHNLESGVSCGFTQATDLQNSDPKLGPLAYNGGLTKTHALLVGSPARNAGSCVNRFDQRHVSRPYGGLCDIGSYEKLLALNDFNGDGIAEVLRKYIPDGRTLVWKMAVNKVSTTLWTSQFNNINWGVVGSGDFNGDNQQDILWQYKPDGRTLIWLMKGNAVIGAQWTSMFFNINWEVADVGDFNGDGLSDILWRYKPDGRTLIWTMNGNNVIASKWTSIAFNLNFEITGVDDFNNDGMTDVLWRHKPDGRTLLWTMQGSAVSLSQWTSQSFNINWEVARIGDFNGDGKADILWRYKPDGRTLIWIMTRNYVIVSKWTSSFFNINWEVVQVGDYSGDGKEDILWRYKPDGRTLVWTMLGTKVALSNFTSVQYNTNWTVE